MNNYAVIGLGRFGMRLASLLGDMGVDVIAIDSNKEHVEQVRDRVSLAACMDAKDPKALKSQGIHKVDVAIVGVGKSFEDNILITVILKELGVKKVISRATSRIRAEILEKVGADEVVNPESEAAERWKNRLVAPSILERIELAQDASLIQFTAPPSMFNKTLTQLEVRKKYNVNIVAIRRTTTEDDQSKQFIISVPMGDTTIREGDVLVIIGSDKDIASLPTK